MPYPVGSTSQSLDVQVTDDLGLPVTGLIAATFPPLTYSRAGANADVAFPALTDLAAITSPFAAGGLKERGEGIYRLDVPNAIFAVAGTVRIRGEQADKRLLYALLAVDSQAVGSGADTVTITIQDTALNPIPDSDVWITSDAAGNVVVAGTRQTDSNGKVVFLLDAGATFFLWSQKDGYNSNLGTEFIAVAD